MIFLSENIENKFIYFFLNIHIQTRRSPLKICQSFFFTHLKSIEIDSKARGNVNSRHRQIDLLTFASHLHHMIASSVVCRDHADVPFVVPFQDHDACFVCPFHGLTCPQLSIGESVREVPPGATGRPTQVRACLKQGFRQMQRREEVVGEHVMVLVEV